MCRTTRNKCWESPNIFPKLKRSPCLIDLPYHVRLLILMQRSTTTKSFRHMGQLSRFQTTRLHQELCSCLVNHRMKDGKWTCFKHPCVYLLGWFGSPIWRGSCILSTKRLAIQEITTKCRHIKFMIVDSNFQTTESNKRLASQKEPRNT